MSETTVTQHAAAPTVAELEAELAARRQHLGATIDELVTRVSPKEIVRRQVEGAQVSFAAATHTPDGELRTERIAAVLGAVSIVLISAGLLRRQAG